MKKNKSKFEILKNFLYILIIEPILEFFKLIHFMIDKIIDTPYFKEYHYFLSFGLTTIFGIVIKEETQYIEAKKLLEKWKEEK